MSDLYKKFGELLKIERQRKGLEIADLSEQLKISESNLEYIETGEVGSLPSKIYFNLFAKAFAEALGIDFDRTIEAIKEDLGEVIEEEEQPPKSAPGKKPKMKPEKPAKEETDKDENGISIKSLLYLFGAIVAVFVVFLVIYLIFFGSGDQGDEQNPTPAEHTEVVASQPEETKAEGEGDEYDWNVPDYQEPQLMKLRLIPRNQSWSTIIADGDTALFQNLNPGRVYNVEAMYRLTVSIGIPSQVDVELNGKAVDLRDPETRRISRVDINQLNLEQILAGDSSAAENTTANQQTPAPAAPVETEQTDTTVDTTDTSVSGGSNDGED